MYRIIRNSKFFNKLNDRFGNRGLVLIFVGVPWVLIGFGFIYMPIERFSREGPGGWLQFLDNPLWGAFWIIGGLSGIVCAFLKVYRTEDGYGFNGITLPPFIWGFFYWWSWFFNLFGDQEGIPDGRSRSWLAACIFWTFTLLIMFLAAKFKDDPDTPKRIQWRRTHGGS